MVNIEWLEHLSASCNGILLESVWVTVEVDIWGQSSKTETIDLSMWRWWWWSRLSRRCKRSQMAAMLVARCCSRYLPWVAFPSRKLWSQDGLFNDLKKSQTLINHILYRAFYGLDKSRKANQHFKLFDASRDCSFWTCLSPFYFGQQTQFLMKQCGFVYINISRG